MHPTQAPDTSPPETGQSWQLTLYIVFIAQLLSIIGFAFTFPFLPFYLRELGVTEERLVPIWAGFIMASSSLVMAFFSPLWGWLADRYGRKIMVVRAMFGGAVITFAMGLIENVWQLLFLRLLSGAATGTISASIAMISTVVPRQKLGYGLGLLMAVLSRRRHDSPDPPSHPHQRPHASPLMYVLFQRKIIRINP
jgi:DHA1 family multidrug resistance protein-like MFS transporter